MKRLLSWGGCCFSFWLQCQPIAAYAEEQIPEPLTLKYALSKASSTESPEMMTYSALKTMAQAEQDLAVSELGIFAEINGRLRYVEPSPILPASETNDSKISLDISKRLFDFGRSNAHIAASKKNLASIDALYTDYTAKRTVAILQAYCNVLLADIIFNHANEAMAIDYVKLDKIRSRFELKQISDIELLEMDNQYRNTRRERNQAQSDQRITRQHLAQLVNPGHLSDKLEVPDFKSMQQLSINRVLPEVDELYQLAYQQNPRLIAKKHELEATRLQMDGYRAESYPVISVHLQAAEYARDMGSSDKYRAGIQFKVPIYQAGQENAKIKLAAGKSIKLDAEMLLIKQDLEQQILTLWLKIDNLKQQLSDSDITMDYRDLYLDRSRALYELEVTSDLGDAMVELTQAQLFQAQTLFELAISWAKLDSLLGNLMTYYE